MRLKPVSQFIKQRQMAQEAGELDLDPHKVTKFKSTLTYWQLVLLGFGNTIASGIFVL